ncbi:hypothetical protein [Nocardia fluminea]|uniref:hypothetical protein n=1 Tax=Nocardia fluminea TaxID=134984 RepID=UPI0033D0292D
MDVFDDPDDVDTAMIGLHVEGVRAGRDRFARPECLRPPVDTTPAWHMRYRHSRQLQSLEAHRVDSPTFYTNIAHREEGVEALLGRRRRQFTSRTNHQLPRVFG